MARRYYSGFGRKSTLFYSRGNETGADLNGIRPAYKIFDVFGCAEDLHLHLTDTKRNTLIGGCPIVSLFGENTKQNFEKGYNELGEYGYLIRS